ncbi:major facilitator superfamily domain-containing protein [Lasiosphaeria ovina]|uniref:Major facilitator superfamily domain-containing protein n=1 Tax=Lasiosphaeria ovina TaxID=92902 RepID=A0AAE0KJI9_9PEZI|nr:major facilitator superfamily domain-containing protein [Lasiosphaeria ovina]
MWSLVQYRRLGRQVEDEVRAASHLHNATHTSKEKQNDGFKLPIIDGGTLEQANLGNQDVGDDNISAQKHDVSQHGPDAGGKYLVRTSGDDDPIDPRNWPLLGRSKNIAILSLLIFAQAWAGAAESMANAAASREYGVSKVTESLSTAMYLFGIGTGALVAGPVSETAGRNPTYLVSTFCYLWFVLGAALATTSFGARIACRFGVGLFASATLSINGSSVRDQFRPVKRSFVFPVIAWANVAAPVIAPIVGGWIVDNPRLGWRWTEWVTLIISAVAFLVALLFLPETYLPLILDWKATHLRRITGDCRYKSQHAEGPSFAASIKTHLLQPARFFSSEPVVAVLGGYLVLLYVLLFTFLSGFDYIFKDTYGLSTGQTGSCFGAIAAGATAFTVLAPWLYSWARMRTEHVRGASLEPEFRLWPGIVAAPLLPVALFWLGWGNYASISIWCGLAACFVFGAILIAIYVSSYEYIVDSYGNHSAIALSSITMLRYLVAGALVMATRPLYGALGVHWTMTLLGCVAVLLAPAPFIFWKVGPRLRAKSPYAGGQGTSSNTKK